MRPIPTTTAAFAKARIYITNLLLFKDRAPSKKNI